MPTPDEFGIVHLTCHCHLAFLFHKNTVLLPQISFESKLDIKSINRQLLTVSVSQEDYIKENYVHI